MKTYDYPKIFKNFRAKHKLTQTDLASLLDTDQSHISKVEKGNSVPTAYQILQLLCLHNDGCNKEIRAMESWKAKD